MSPLTSLQRWQPSVQISLRSFWSRQGADEEPSGRTVAGNYRVATTQSCTAREISSHRLHVTNVTAQVKTSCAYVDETTLGIGGQHPSPRASAVAMPYASPSMCDLLVAQCSTAAARKAGGWWGRRIPFRVTGAPHSRQLDTHACCKTNLGDPHLSSNETVTHIQAQHTHLVLTLRTPR